jgi:hypothetical protein
MLKVSPLAKAQTRPMRTTMRAMTPRRGPCCWTTRLTTTSWWHACTSTTCNPSRRTSSRTCEVPGARHIVWRPVAPHSRRRGVPDERRQCCAPGKLPPWLVLSARLPLRSEAVSYCPRTGRLRRRCRAASSPQAAPRRVARASCGRGAKGRRVWRRSTSPRAIAHPRVCRPRHSQRCRSSSLTHRALPGAPQAPGRTQSRGPERHSHTSRRCRRASPPRLLLAWSLALRTLCDIVVGATREKLHH